MQGESVSIEESIEGVQRHTPFIVAFGSSDDDLSDTKIVIEKENILSMPTLDMAVHCCFAAYYIFNISYPPDLSPFLLFLEQYIYRLKASQKLPLTVSIVMDCLEKTCQQLTSTYLSSLSLNPCITFYQLVLLSWYVF